MSSRLKSNLLKYGISALVCGILVFIYVDSRDFAVQDRMEQYRILCDAFTIPGVLAIMFALLMAISNEGFFLGLSYAVGVAMKSLVPGGRLKIEKYYDYVERRKGKRIIGYGFLYLVGGICMAVALVCMVLFYRLYGK